MKTTVRTKIMTIMGAVAAAGTLAGGIAATAPLAHADTGPGPRAITAVNLRIGPSTQVGIRAVAQAGDELAIACVSPGTPVEENRDWYALTDRKGWISATLVEGVLAAGATVTVVCGARDDVIDDAHRWFLLAGGNWVTGAYLPSVPPEEVHDCDA